MFFVLTFLACSDTLTKGEQELLKEHIEDIRKGIRPFDGLPNESLGICKPGSSHPKYGYKECEEFIGKDGENLPPGEYILYSHFSSPNITPTKKGWKVEFKRDCKITKTTKNGQSVTTNSYNKTYHVKNYGGKGNHISPLATIQSPSASGAQECNWVLTLFNTNGNKEIRGSWSVPAK